MKTCFYYWLVEPVANEVTDDPSRSPAFNIPIDYDGAKYDFALFLNSANLPEFGRLTILNLREENIPESLLPLLQIAKEHLLSTLRFTFDINTTLFPYSIWTYTQNGKPHSLRLQLTIHEDQTFDVKRAENFFGATFSHREELRLLIDGTDARIPLQYRFLSLYKILESEFKMGGKWIHRRLDAFLNSYQPDFSHLGIVKKPSKFLHELRDRCAHIRTGKKQEVFGVTHLNHKEATLVQKILPLLARISRDVINTSANGRFVITTVPSGHAEPSAQKIGPAGNTHK